ncbi:MAG: hypothetical protein JSW41_02115 [Candidatus Aenigmatarchaeota archaeon]|nr:MAG: hypothetical protein JSW41_02115 [Candidatus Aenigmarchaeota archaeon]
MSVMDTLVITVIYALPLAMIGVYYLTTNQIIPRVQKSRGRLLVLQLKPNGGFSKFYGKPIIENVTEKIPTKVKKKYTDPETGEVTEKEEVEEIDTPVSGGFIKRKGKELQFFNTPDLVYDYMNTKMTMYDTEGNQVSINLAKRIMPTVSPKLLDSLVTRVWNAGRATKFTQKKDVLFLALIAAGASGLSLILLFTILQILEGLPICVMGG